MSERTPSPETLQVGEELPEAAIEMSWEKLMQFNRYVTGGKDTKNIHTDDETARRAGLPRAIATGRHPVDFIAERMVDLFGAGFVAGGKIDVTFVKPIMPGDTIRITAKVKEKIPENGKTRVVLDVALVNPKGEPFTVGTASALAG